MAAKQVANRASCFVFWHTVAMHTTSPVAATPTAFIRAIVRAYALRHLSPNHALQQAQIAPHLLENPDARITAWQMERISDTAMRELDDEALGWFRRRLPWGSYGMLVRASISAPTLEVALKRWCRHHGLLTADSLGHGRAGGAAGCTFRPMERIAVPYRLAAHRPHWHHGAATAAWHGG